MGAAFSRARMGESSSDQHGDDSRLPRKGHDVSGGSWGPSIVHQVVVLPQRRRRPPWVQRCAVVGQATPIGGHGATWSEAVVHMGRSMTTTTTMTLVDDGASNRPSIPIDRAFTLAKPCRGLSERTAHSSFVLDFSTWELANRTHRDRRRCWRTSTRGRCHRLGR